MPKIEVNESLFFKMLEGAVFIMRNMGKFSDTMINQDDLVDIRENR